MLDFREHLRLVRRAPGMFLLDPTFDAFVAYVVGVNAGSSQALLPGFDEFLTLRLAERSNLHWSGLVKQIAFPRGIPQPLAGRDEEIAISTMFDLLDEFLAEIRGPRELHRLFHEFVLWETEQPGYDVNRDLVRFGQSPPFETVSVNDAVAILGLTRPEIFDMIARGDLHHARVGADVLVRAAEVQERAKRSVG